jgi:hypothetical protein
MTPSRLLRLLIAVISAFFSDNFNRFADTICAQNRLAIFYST